MKHFFLTVLIGILCITGMFDGARAAETEEMIVGVTESSSGLFTSSATTGEEQSSGESETDVSLAAESTAATEANLKNTVMMLSEYAAGTSLIEDFPLIYQEPELPTGCEITALTMVLNYYGFDADKMEMTFEYLPTLFDEGFYYAEDGRLMGNDMENYFIGNPTEESGYICGTGAIVTAANRYLETEETGLRAKDITGTPAEELYELIADGTPVVVWATIEMEERGEVQGWYREDGVFMEWSSNDHGTVLIGYTEDTVILSDPISGRYEADREDFEAVYEERGCKSVILA